jgi:hypothetical protein
MLKLNTWLGLLLLLIPVVSFAGWVNHIITCFQEELWGFLIAGAIMFPIGIIHGIWLWF